MYIKFNYYFFTFQPNYIVALILKLGGAIITVLIAACLAQEYIICLARW